MKRILFYFFMALSLTSFSQERSLALVIGNSAYKQGEVLKYAVSDAYLMSFTLEDLGFEVISATDASLGKMEDLVADFMEQMEGYDVGLIYFAGHGIQLDGINYLLPIDAKLKRPGDLKKEAIDANKLVEQFGELSTRVKVVVLDACGNEPFRPWVEAGTEGLAAMTVPEGSIIAFAAAPGSIASEGSGSNGLYVESLTRQMVIPQTIDKVFANTSLLVSHASKDRQSPKEWSKLKGSFSLVAGDPRAMKKTGSIMITSRIAGQLYLEEIELSTVEPNSVTPLDNMAAGTYKLKIAGDESWEEEVLVLENQVSNITAQAAPAEVKAPVKAIAPVTGNIFVDPRDSKQYAWIELGTQTWMARNLAFNASGGSYCYGSDASNCDIYGRLYTWEIALEACPDGWHLPSDAEWMALELFTGMKQKAVKRIGLRGKTEGDILKDHTSGVWGSAGSTSISANGFNALPGGYLNQSNSVNKGKVVVFWTSTKYKGQSAIHRKIEDSKGGIHRYYSDQNKGYAVRCIKD